MKNRPPCSLESEQALIGTLILRPESIPIAFGIIKPEDCYEKRHQTVLQAINELSFEGLTPDLPTIADRLIKSSTGIDITWLSGLTDNIPFTGKVKQYADTIKKHSLARKQIALHNQAAEQLFNGEDPNEVASTHFTKLSKSLSSTQGSAASLSEITPVAIQAIEDACNGDRCSVGISSNFHELDRIIGGFRPAELIILAARPSMGKTALALNIIKHAALSGHTVLFFSLEMSKEALAQRLVTDIADVSYSAIRNADLTPKEMDQIHKCQAIIEALPVIIDDRAGLNINQIEARTAQIATKQKVDMIVVDYLQLCRAKAESRFVEVSEVSNFLKNLAKKFSVPVLALSQLSRDIEKRPDPTPRLSDLRESGAIEQDADLIIFISGKKEAVTRKLNVAKQRNGPLGNLDLKFIGWHQRFETISFSQ